MTYIDFSLLQDKVDYFLARKLSCQSVAGKLSITLDGGQTIFLVIMMTKSRCLVSSLVHIISIVAGGKVKGCVLFQDCLCTDV